MMSFRNRMLRSLPAIVLVAIDAFFAAALPANAVNYTFTTIDVPGAVPGSTSANGINNSGQIVGTFTAGGRPRLPRHRRQLHPNRRARRGHYRRPRRQR